MKGRELGVGSDMEEAEDAAGPSLPDLPHCMLAPEDLIFPTTSFPSDHAVVSSGVRFCSLA